MREIGQGIRVYYKNQKDFPNTIFFPDGTVQYYDDGAMLFEVISDEAIELLTEKPLNRLGGIT